MIERRQVGSFGMGSQHPMDGELFAAWLSQGRESDDELLGMRLIADFFTADPFLVEQVEYGRRMGQFRKDLEVLFRASLLAELPAPPVIMFDPLVAFGSREVGTIQLSPQFACIIHAGNRLIHEDTLTRTTEA